MKCRQGAAAFAVAALVLVGASPAGADPQAPSPTTVTCDGVTYDVAVAGSGAFAPAHDLNSTRVLVPTSFGTFSGTVYDESGAIVDQFTDPSTQVKGMGARDAKADVIDCTYTITEVGDGSDPNLPAGDTFIGEGTVRGFIPSGR